MDKIINTEYLVLGAGVAGLSCAYFLNQRDENFLLIERNSEVGGLSRTFDFEGNRYDSGAHRLHFKSKEIENLYRGLLGDRLVKVESPSKIFFKGKLIDFPLQPVNLILKLSFKDLWICLMSYLKKPKTHVKNNFEQNAIVKYGQKISEFFLFGYSEKLWGASVADLSIAVSGKRLNGLSVKNLLLETISKKISTKHLDGVFYYPKKGIGELVEVLSEGIDKNLHLNSEVVSVKYQDQGYIVSTSNATFKTKHLISTIPSNILSEKLMSKKSDLSFRSLILLTLRLSVSNFSKYASIYFPDKNIVVTRLYECKNRSKLMSPENETLITLEIPFEGEDVQELISKGLAQFKNLFPRIEKNIISQEVKVLRNAYPKLTLASEVEFTTMRESFQDFSNLSLVGRSAEFKYMHLHDVILAAKSTIARI